MINRIAVKLMNLKSERWLPLASFAAFFLVVGLLLPWWGVVLAGALVGFLLGNDHGAAQKAFFAAFAGWLIAAFVQDAMTGFRLGGRIASVFHLGVSPIAYLLTGLLGGALAGLGALNGGALKDLLAHSRSRLP